MGRYLLYWIRWAINVALCAAPEIGASNATTSTGSYESNRRPNAAKPSVG
ncbi:MAG: hypothetical protein IPQ07_22200 [Myxococcales bacterium]|nr:hypothetical protein [Myxococcales bacterium]